MGGDAGDDVGRSAEDGGYGGRARGQAVEDGGDSLVHAKSWRRYGCSSATFIIRSTSTSSLFYFCEYKCFSLYVHAQGQTTTLLGTQCNIDGIYLSCLTHATTHATLMVYIYLVSHTCNLFSFVQNQSMALNSVPRHLGGSPGSYVGPTPQGQAP